MRVRAKSRSHTWAASPECRVPVPEHLPAVFNTWCVPAPSAVLVSHANSCTSPLDPFQHLLVPQLSPATSQCSPQLSPCKLSLVFHVAYLMGDHVPPKTRPLSLYVFCDLPLKAALESFSLQSGPPSPELPHLGLPDSHSPLCHLFPPPLPNKPRFALRSCVHHLPSTEIDSAVVSTSVCTALVPTASSPCFVFGGWGAQMSGLRTKVYLLLIVSYPPGNDS